MNLNSDNLEYQAFRNYTNPNSSGLAEFREDFAYYKYIKKLSKKIVKGNSKNLRLLTNHVICYTNNFKLNFVKQSLKFDSTSQQLSVILSILLYLGYLEKHEYSSDELDLDTLKMLKEL